MPQSGAAVYTAYAAFDNLVEACLPRLHSSASVQRFSCRKQILQNPHLHLARVIKKNQPFAIRTHVQGPNLVPRKAKGLCFTAVGGNRPNLVALSSSRWLGHKEEATSRAPDGGIWPGEKLTGFEFLIVSRKVEAGSDFRRRSAPGRYRH